jgi:hypothetical protein
MDDGEPPAHQFHLNSNDGGVTADVGHNPFEADAVTDIGERAAEKNVAIFENASTESESFANVRV